MPTVVKTQADVDTALSSGETNLEVRSTGRLFIAVEQPKMEIVLHDSSVATITTRGSSRAEIAICDTSRATITINGSSRAEIEICGSSHAEIGVYDSSRAGVWTCGTSFAYIRAYGTSHAKISINGSSHTDISIHGTSHATINAYESSCADIRAHGTSHATIKARDSSLATIKAHDSSRAEISTRGTSRADIRAYESSQADIRAHGSSRAALTIYDSSLATIETYDSSRAGISTHGTSRAEIRAHESSQADIRACYWSTVFVSGPGACSVRAGCSALVRLATDAVNVSVASGSVQRMEHPATASGWCDMFAATVVDGVATLYKAVDDEYRSGRGFAYRPGTVPVAPDWDEGKAECGGGLHFCATPRLAKAFCTTATRYVACPVKLTDMAVVKTPQYPSKVKAKGCCSPTWEVDIDGNPLTGDEPCRQ